MVDDTERARALADQVGPLKGITLGDRFAGKISEANAIELVNACIIGLRPHLADIIASALGEVRSEEAASYAEFIEIADLLSRATNANPDVWDYKIIGEAHERAILAMQRRLRPGETCDICGGK